MQDPRILENWKAIASYLGPTPTPNGPRHVYMTACRQKVLFPMDRMPSVGSSVRAGEGDEECPHCFPVSAAPKVQKPKEEEPEQDSNLDDSLGNIEVEGDDHVLHEESDPWAEKPL